MKNTKIILGMISVFLFLLVFICPNVLAVEQVNPALKLTEISAESFSEKINEQSPEFAMESNYFRITQIGDENGNRKPNMYCAKEGVGFESRNINPETKATENNVDDSYIDTYEYKYNMSSPANDGEKTAIQGMYSKYNEILALADLFYLDNSEKSVQDYLKEIYSRENFNFEVSFDSLVNFKDGSALITVEQLKAVQQAALWYFTNYDNEKIRAWLLSEDEINNTAVNFLYYRTGLTTTINGDKFVSLGGRPVNEDENHITIQDDNLRKVLQDWQAKKLFKYFVETAISYSANTNHVNQNTVYLYIKKTIEREKDASYKEKSQPVIEIVPGKKEFDLALRKYITKVGNTVVTDRIPNIDTKESLDKDDTTAIYKHKKEPVEVKSGSLITYTITVYNEGDFAGKATKIVDQLPKGVEFSKTETEAITENANYTFEYDETANKVTIKAKDNLANLRAYNGTLDSTSVQVVVKVTETPDTEKDKILTNIAYISEEYNASSNKTYSGEEKGFDRDSAPGTYPNKTANELISDDVNNYKGNTSNKDVEPADSDYFYKGEEDEDDFEKIVIKPEQMDLALRKFITKVGNKEVTDRIPQITGKTIEGEDTTAEKKHSKEAISVSKGAKIVYTIRVYNEGSVDGYAKEVTDYLPEGLDLAKDSTINSKYGWTADGRTIKTSYLADKMLKAVNREYSKFNNKDAETQGYYRDLQIECVVNDKAKYDEKTKKSNLKNIAEITEQEDKNGNKKDEDSTPKSLTDKEKEDYSPKDSENGKGYEDDDDFEDLKILDFDLALRKFITKINDKNITTRIPEVKYENGKISYSHTKEPEEVVNGNIVTYTIRIFNEGQVNGYAQIVTDDIPEGLEFLPEHNTNKQYRWVMYAELKDGEKVEDESKVVECQVNGSSEVKKYVETTDAKKAVIIRTDYLSKEQGEKAMKEGETENPNLLKAFDETKKISETNPDNRDVLVAFRVVEPNGSKRTLINYAQISEDADENGDEITDIDSTPDKWNEGEDDQDIEKIRIPEFDLALRKWVTQAIVIENGKQTVTNTGHDAWDDPEGIVKVELHRKKLSNVTVKFKYSIRVYNQGEIDGYAKEITDYVPEGLKFVAADNPGWKDEGNNVISTKLLENKLLKAKTGYADVEVVLTWINGSDNLGLKTNVAEISEDYNKKGVPDKDSVPDNKKPGEDDIDDAPVMLSIATGEITYIVIGISVLAVIAGGVFLIKKYVL